MTKYAIVNKRSEFYPDPIYTDAVKASAKIDYLNQYRMKHKMEDAGYALETLGTKREEQHNKEWTAWVKMMGYA